MAFMAVCVNAQVTWNVRAGIGVQDFCVHHFIDDYRNCGEEVITSTFGILKLETNIPFKKGGSLTFSPSLSITCDGGDYDVYGIYLPLHLGYKIYGEKWFVCPKIGPTIRYCDYSGEAQIGFSIELPYEYKHFIVALESQYIFGCLPEGEGGAALTFGYKF